MANAYAKAVCFGIIAGMRSMSAPALISGHYAKRHSAKLDASPLRFMASPAQAAISRVFAAGELIADKTSFIPDRIDPVPLAFRAVSGALCGATICTAEHKDAKIGAIAGSLAAIASAFACYHLRRKIRKSTDLPNALLGLTEDAVALGFGIGILGSKSRL